MFSFLDKDKGRRKTTTDSDDRGETVTAPGTEISYQKSLISKYREEHGAIQSFFNTALTAYQLGNDAEFLSRLRNLQIALRRHLLDEELNLYIYLRHCHRGDGKKQELITRFKKNSKNTATTTFSFIRQVTEEGAAISRDEVFLSRFLEIGNILETLMAAEEAHLYPIYRLPSQGSELSV